MARIQQHWVSVAVLLFVSLAVASAGRELTAGNDFHTVPEVASIPLNNTQQEPEMHVIDPADLAMDEASMMDDEGSRRELASLPDVMVDVGKSIVNTVHERFLCMNLDWPSQGGCRMPWASWPQCRWFQSSFYYLDLNHPNVANALKALSPALVRIGGKRQDQVKYLTSCSDGFCITQQRWDAWNALLQRTGAACLFGINMMAGTNSVSVPWNPSNAAAFIRYTVAKKYKTVIGWAFGNEPLKFSSTSMTVTKYATDLKMFRRVIDNAYAGASIPKALVVAGELWPQTSFYKTVLNVAGKATADVLSIHQYRMVSKAWMSKNGPQPQRVFNESWLDAGMYTYTHFPPAFKSYAAPKTQVWMTETGGVLYGDFNYWDWDMRSTAFSNSFWYLDELCVAAKTVEVYCRQSMVGGMWGMLDNFNGYAPFADFYAAMAFKKLMGTKVLPVTLSRKGVRSYAFCTRGRPNYITLLHMNLMATRAIVRPRVGGVRVQRHELYVFTPDGDTMKATGVRVNGKPLKGYTMPPPSVLVYWAVILPPKSYTFDVVAAPAGFTLCR